MACSCKSRKRIGAIKKRKTMARRKLQIMDVITTGAAAGAGMIIGKQVNRVPQIANSPLLSAGAQILIASFLISGAGTKKFQRGIGIGMAASGVVDLIKGVAGPDVASTLGISGIGAFQYQLAAGSTIMPGVAGSIGKRKPAGNTFVTY